MAAAAAGISAADVKKFQELTKKLYNDQAKWYLNGFWGEGAEAESETVWKCAQKFIELDPKKKAGNELEEHLSHKFLESFGETLTVLALREQLRKIDMDANGKMALLEYLLFKYKKTVPKCITNPQGGSDNKEQLDEAQSKLESAQNALSQLLEQLAVQAKKLEEQQKAEAAVKASEAELRAAVDDLKAQEDAYKNAIDALEKKIAESTGVVVKNKAANELAQLKAKDPMPLSRAKLTQSAALRKVEKERKVVEAATKACEEQKRAVEKSVADTEKKANEAQELLEELRKKGGTAKGTVWWMMREIKEAQKYLPKSKQTL
jgi:chromosome segregation ATPase